MSISSAWDETWAFLVSEGRLLAPLALALMFLPEMIVGVVSPPKPTLTTEPMFALLFLLEALIGVTGQIAIARLALGHRERLGDSLVHAARRLPSYIGSVFLFALPMSIALAAVLTAAQSVQKGGNAGMALVLSLILVVLFVSLIILVVRTLLNTAIAAVEPGGPLTILKRGFALTRGQVLRLLGAALLFIVGGGIASLAITVAVGFLVTLLLGPPEPLTVSALLISTARAATQAALLTVFTIFFARVYARRAVSVSVPSSAT